MGAVWVLRATTRASYTMWVEGLGEHVAYEKSRAEAGDKRGVDYGAASTSAISTRGSAGRSQDVVVTATTNTGALARARAAAAAAPERAKQLRNSMRRRLSSITGRPVQLYEACE